MRHWERGRSRRAIVPIIGHSRFWSPVCGSIGTAINIIATILCSRCPGAEARPHASAGVALPCAGGHGSLFAITPLSAARIMLLMRSRYLGGHFFDTQAGGSAVLWMHFFWIFRSSRSLHTGYSSLRFLVGNHSRLFAQTNFRISGDGRGDCRHRCSKHDVWAHHVHHRNEFLRQLRFFAITTMVIGVPTGIKIFNWIGTMWGGRIQFKVPMLFCIGFLVQFLIAGLTGIMQATVPFDWQLSLSYFVVAHFHYVIVGGILFALFGAFYYWYPKMTGRMLSERLGKWHFWLFLIGFHLTFDVMHIPGILGMPRRIYTYEPGRGWDTLNLIVSIGAFIQAIAILVFVANLIISYFKGADAGNDPWDAWTLEWSTSSPPPAYNFATVPTVEPPSLYGT